MTQSLPEMNYGQMVSTVVNGVLKASGTFLTDGAELRSRLLDDGVITQIPQGNSVPKTMCAVDGGRITKQQYAGDLLVAYATSAEAESAEVQGSGASQQWGSALPHSKDTDKVCGIAMMCLEQAVLNSVDHETRLIDGSFYSPVIEINRTLGISDTECRKTAAKLITDYRLIENLTEIYKADSPRRFLALPKSDSSRDYGNYLSARYDVEISVSDKVLAAHILRPGEMLIPRTLDLWKNPNLLSESSEWRAGRNIAQAFKEALAPATHAAMQDRLVVSYLKGQNPLTVVKVEYFRPHENWDEADAWVTSTVERECRFTHAQEPAAQYKADIQAKGVANVERQLRELVIAELLSRGKSDIAALFSMQYRT